MTKQEAIAAIKAAIDEYPATVPEHKWNTGELAVYVYSKLSRQHDDRSAPCRNCGIWY